MSHLSCPGCGERRPAASPSSNLCGSCLTSGGAPRLGDLADLSVELGRLELEVKLAKEDVASATMDLNAAERALAEFERANRTTVASLRGRPKRRAP